MGLLHRVNRNKQSITMVAKCDTRTYKHKKTRSNSGSTAESNSIIAMELQSPSAAKQKKQQHHFIEAIVFSADVLCGVCNNNNNNNADYSVVGGFDARREGIISYENFEDLTRKVDALFHRKRSPLSTGAASKMNEDKNRKDDDDLGFDTTSTCPSTTDASLVSVERRYEYGYHLDDDLDLNPIVRNNNTDPSPSTLSTIATAAADNDGSSEQEYCLFEDDENDEASVDYLPEFLKGTNFKTGRNISSNARKQERKQLDAIPLPKKPSSCAAAAKPLSSSSSSLLGGGSIVSAMKSGSGNSSSSSSFNVSAIRNAAKGEKEKKKKTRKLKKIAASLSLFKKCSCL